MINENKSSYYREIEVYKQEVYSPYNQLWAIKTNISAENKLSSEINGFSL